MKTDRSIKTHGPTSSSKDNFTPKRGRVKFMATDKHCTSFVSHDFNTNSIQIIDSKGFIVQTLKIPDPNSKIYRIHNTHPGMFLGYGGTGSGFSLKIFHYTALHRKIEVDISKGIEFLIESVRKNRMDIRIFIEKLAQYHDLFPDLVDKYEMVKLLIVLGKMDFLKD